MLASVRWGSILLAVGLGVLALAVASLVMWLILAALDVAGAVGAATSFGTVVGFGVAGWVAGGRAPFSAWFHGALAALGVAMLVVVTSLRGGSPAPTSQVLLIAVIAIVMGSVAGSVAGRRAV